MSIYPETYSQDSELIHLVWDGMENDEIELGREFEKQEIEFLVALDALFDAGYEDHFYSYRLDT